MIEFTYNALQNVIDIANKRSRRYKHSSTTKVKQFYEQKKFTVLNNFCFVFKLITLLLTVTVTKTKNADSDDESDAM